jgi:hypothetical protein
MNRPRLAGCAEFRGLGLRKRAVAAGRRSVDRSAGRIGS